MTYKTKVSEILIFLTVIQNSLRTVVVNFIQHRHQCQWQSLVGIRDFVSSGSEIIMRNPSWHKVLLCFGIYSIVLFSPPANGFAFSTLGSSLFIFSVMCATIVHLQIFFIYKIRGFHFDYYTNDNYIIIYLYHNWVSFWIERLTWK